MVFSARYAGHGSSSQDRPVQRRDPGRRCAHLRDRAEKPALPLLQPWPLQRKAGARSPPLPQSVRGSDGIVSSKDLCPAVRRLYTPTLTRPEGGVVETLDIEKRPE